MTVAAGFVCLDGIIICADTQETIPGYTKGKTEKILDFWDKNFGIVITGSGDDSHLIKAVSQEIEDAVFDEWTPGMALYEPKARELMQQTWANFVHQHLLIYPAAERPQLELLIAIREHHNHYLYKASATVVREVKADADVIGSGQLLARSFIEKMYNPFMELEDLVIVAAYVLFQAKQYVDGCGGSTDLYILSDKYKFDGRIPTPALRQIENKFAEFDDPLFPSFLFNICNPNVSSDDFDRALGNFKKWATEFRKDLSSGLFYETMTKLKDAPVSPVKHVRYSKQSAFQTLKGRQ